MHKVRGHTRNRSEAPLLEGDFTDEEEEEEKMENTDVRIYIYVFLGCRVQFLVSICILHILQSACQVRLQMGEERDSDDEVRRDFCIKALKYKERLQ